MEVADWVERLGGWGVVLLIVRWMMSRQDRMIDGLIGSTESHTEFRQEWIREWHQYRVEDNEVHRKIVDQLRDLNVAKVGGQ